MTVAQANSDEGGGGFAMAMLFFVMLAIFVGFGWYFAQQQQVFTQHALNSHSNQAWNAVKINSALTNGTCAPQQYACPGNKMIRWCVLPKPDKKGNPLAIGLVIGMVGEVEHIISGFAGTPQDWSDPGKRCR